MIDENDYEADKAERDFEYAQFKEEVTAGLNTLAERSSNAQWMGRASFLLGAGSLFVAGLAGGYLLCLRTVSADFEEVDE